VFFADAKVVQMHVLARPDLARREADDLVVAAHRTALGDRARRDLVAGRHEPADGDSFRLDQDPGHQLTPRDDDIVCRIESENERDFCNMAASA